MSQWSGTANSSTAGAAPTGASTPPSSGSGEHTWEQKHLRAVCGALPPVVGSSMSTNPDTTEPFPDHILMIFKAWPAQQDVKSIRRRTVAGLAPGQDPGASAPDER